MAQASQKTGGCGQSRVRHRTTGGGSGTGSTCFDAPLNHCAHSSRATSPLVAFWQVGATPPIPHSTRAAIPDSRLFDKVLSGNLNSTRSVAEPRCPQYQYR